MRIQFDDRNLTAEVVGDVHGITRAEFKQHSPKALEALAGFKKTVEDGSIGFPHLPFQNAVAKDILKYANGVRGSYETVCLVGIGGSALGAWALDCAIRGPHPVQGAFSKKHPRLVILDNVDPVFTQLALESMDPKKTLVVVATKSGSTAETAATFLIVREWMKKKLGRKAFQRIIAITTEEKGDLYELAMREGYRMFYIPTNVGGRFSVMSPVGMVPAALIGIDVRKVFKGAAQMTHLCWQADLKKNLALRAALVHWLSLVANDKPIQVAFPYSNLLWGMAFWFRQLWAESLGKSHQRSGEFVNIGQTPVAALGVTDQHSQVQLYIEGPNDKLFTFWAVAKHRDSGKIPTSALGLGSFDYLGGQTLDKLIDSERRSTEAALVEAGRPNCTFTLERVDEEHLGAFFQLLEFETAFMGELLDINAFDQAGVELGKQFTYGLMGRPNFEAFADRFNQYEKKRG